MSEPGGAAATPAPRRHWPILAASFTAFTIGAAMMHSYTVFLVAFVEYFG